LIILKLIWTKSSFFASNPKACLPAGRDGMKISSIHPSGRGKIEEICSKCTMD
jgi:hypothetical protein